MRGLIGIHLHQDVLEIHGDIRWVIWDLLDDCDEETLTTLVAQVRQVIRDNPTEAAMADWISRSRWAVHPHLGPGWPTALEFMQWILDEAVADLARRQAGRARRPVPPAERTLETRWATASLPWAEHAPTEGERFITLLTHRGVVIEEILSSDTPSTEEQVLDHDEWVVVLDGMARLVVDGNDLSLVPGEHLAIAAGTPHRVLSTHQNTRWLAVHLPREEA